MTLKEAFSNLRTDIRELKTAAEAHNVASDEDPTNIPHSSEDGTPGSIPNASDSLPSYLPITNTASSDPAVVHTGPPSITTIQSSGAATVRSEPTVAHNAYVPPPPPKNLPHGWTARYDEKEGKFSYSHGVDSKNEQWNFPNEKSPEKPTAESA